MRNFLSNVQQNARAKTPSIHAWLLGSMALAQTRMAYAGGGGGSLTEVEGTAAWVLNIFSPGLLLTLLTILLIGCGIAVYLGKMGGQLFLRILIGSILVFGGRTIAPKLIALF